MQNMAMQAAANAAGSSAAGVASAATAAAAAAAAQSGLAATVAGAAQSAGLAGAASAGAATAAAAATLTAVVAVAATTGFGPDNSSNATFCGYPNLGYRQGSIVMFMEGIPRPFTKREALVVEGVLVDSYNKISGVCVDLFQREMLNTTLVEQLFYDELDGTPNVLETRFNAWVKCEDCPNEEAMKKQAAEQEKPETGGFDWSKLPLGDFNPAVSYTIADDSSYTRPDNFTN